MKLSSIIIYLSLLYGVFVLSQLFPTDTTGMVVLAAKPAADYTPIFIVAISLLMTTVSATYILTRKKKPVAKQAPLLHTIIQHSKYGFTAAHTKQYLMSKGYELKELDIVDLFFYIGHELKRGIPAATVKHNCVKEGWKPKDVDAIIGHFLLEK